MVAADEEIVRKGACGDRLDDKKSIDLVEYVTNVRALVGIYVYLELCVQELRASFTSRRDVGSSRPS